MKYTASILSVLFVGVIAAATSAQEKKGGVAAPAAQPTPLDAACPSDMVEVEGDYCPDLEQHCKYNTNIDGTITKNPDGSVKKADLLWACGEYEPSVCKSDHLVHMHFCMDKYEWPNKEGQVPQDWITWYDAKKAVELVGKRLCTHREWTLAAEGPNMHPLPYGDGFHRDSSICNFDRPMGHLDPSKAKKPDDEMSQKLRDMLVPSGSMPNCVSDFGVHDMAGNVDEFVVNEGGATECPTEMRRQNKCMQVSYISGLMGGHVWHVRNASRPMTTAHYPGFGWYETGTRACKDIQ
jgi:formylglycine-generating enzyme required for sulfatase activity